MEDIIRLLPVMLRFGVGDKINISGVFTTGQIGGVVLLAIMAALVWMTGRSKKEK